MAKLKGLGRGLDALLGRDEPAATTPVGTSSDAQRELAVDQLQPGKYRITFETSAYFAAHNIASFYPEICVTFFIQDIAQHYHVPLLLSPFGYSTYRGS